MKFAQYWYELIRDKFLSLCQSITNFNPGSRIRSIFEAAGLALEELSFRLDAMYQGLFASTAKFDDLDWRGLELGVTRKPAKKSNGYVRFYGDADTKIPEGTIVSTNPDIEPVIEFISLETKTIIEDYIDVAVEAKETGRQGNVEAEKANYLPESISGIGEAKNISAIAGGEDIEDDESYRKRIVLRWYELSSGGTEEFYRSKTLGIEGISDARVKSCAYGPGTVLIYAWSKDTSGKLIPVSDSKLEEIKDYWDEHRPLCIKIYSEKPTGIIADLFLFVKPATGYVFTTISDLVAGVITNHFNALVPGQGLILNKLIAEIMVIEGIDDLKLEIPKTNLYPAATETLILGRVQIQPFLTPTMPETGVVW
jgi:uncharacterized phage protein gp47/JayE